MHRSSSFNNRPLLLPPTLSLSNSVLTNEWIVLFILTGSEEKQLRTDEPLLQTPPGPLQTPQPHCWQKTPTVRPSSPLFSISDGPRCRPASIHLTLFYPCVAWTAGGGGRALLLHAHRSQMNLGLYIQTYVHVKKKTGGGV